MLTLNVFQSAEAVARQKAIICHWISGGSQPVPESRRLVSFIPVGDHLMEKMQAVTWSKIRSNIRSRQAVSGRCRSCMHNGQASVGGRASVRYTAGDMLRSIFLLV